MAEEFNSDIEVAGGGVFGKPIIGSSYGGIISKALQYHPSLNRLDTIYNLPSVGSWASSSSVCVIKFKRTGTSTTKLVVRIATGFVSSFVDVLFTMYFQQTTNSYKRVQFIQGRKDVWDGLDFYFDYDATTEEDIIYIHFVSGGSRPGVTPLSLASVGTDVTMTAESFDIQLFGSLTIPSTAIKVTGAFRIASDFVDWEFFNAQTYATETWVNSNFVPKPHPVYNITQAQITNWDEAYTNSHTHANQTVLDFITLSNYSNWNACSSWLNNHGGKWQNWDAAYTNSHNHNQNLDPDDTVNFKRVTTTDGFILSGSNNSNVLLAGGGKASTNKEVEIRNDELRLKPKIIIIDDADFELNPSSNAGHDYMLVHLVFKNLSANRTLMLRNVYEGQEIKVYNIDNSSNINCSHGNVTSNTVRTYFHDGTGILTHYSNN